MDAGGAGTFVDVYFAILALVTGIANALILVHEFLAQSVLTRVAAALGDVR